jgi:hypothetical protein
MLHIVARDAGVDFGGPVADAPDFTAKSGSTSVPTASGPGVITAADQSVDYGSRPGSDAVDQNLEVDGKSTIGERRPVISAGLAPRACFCVLTSHP